MQAMDDGLARAELNALFDELDHALRCLMAQLERSLDSCLRGESPPRADGLARISHRMGVHRGSE